MASGNNSKIQSTAKKHIRKAIKKNKTARTISGIFFVCMLIAAGLFYYFGGAELLGFGKDQIGQNTLPAEGIMEVHIIDIGQGDSILVTTSGGAMLIDAGPNSSENDLRNYLNAAGISKLDYLVLTHFDEDHIGGADMILNEYTVSEVILPDTTATTATFERMIDALEKSQAQATYAAPGQNYSLGTMTATVIAPETTKNVSANNTSIVMKLQFGSNSFMMTGDASEESEESILERYDADSLKCDFLKIGHHGSTSSTTTAFLAAVSPSIAAISCAEDNSYGHPHTPVLDRLEEQSVTVYRTDLEGSLLFECDGQTIRKVNKK